jgi:hypothetical protein
MLKSKSIIIACLLFVCVEANAQKDIPRNVIDTLKTVNNLFTKTEIFLDKEITAKELGGINDYVMDKHRNIFVTDREQIYKFNSAGKLLKKIRKTGEGPGEFKSIGVMTADGEGNLYIEDGSGNKIVKYSNNLVFIKEFRKEITGAADKMFIKDNKYLVCYYSCQPIEVMAIYDNDTGIIAAQKGKGNKLCSTLIPTPTGGGITLCGNKIYFVHPVDPQIHVLDNDREYDLLKKLPYRFVPAFSNSRMSTYSLTVDLLSYANILFLITTDPGENGRFMPLKCNIYSTSGELIRDNIPAGYITKSKKYSGNEFYRITDMRYKGDVNAGVVLSILEMKNKW